MRSLRALVCVCVLPACSLAVRAAAAPDAALDRPAPAEVAHVDDASDAAPPEAPPDRAPIDATPDVDARPDAASTDLTSADEVEAPASCLPGATAPCYSGAPSTVGVGRCLGGTRICDADGRWAAACLGEVTPAGDDSSCNEVDDDCNGVIDDLCEGCVPGYVRQCYAGRSALPLVGRCRAGRQLCDFTGLFSVGCPGEVRSADDETCGDGVDDDCNGAVDEGCGACAAAQQRPCYSGPAGTEGVGVCHGGFQRCGPALTWAARCEDELTPAEEVCGNGLDDDCNGFVDDRCGGCAEASRACYSAEAATRDVGRCRAGTQYCAGRPVQWREACDREVTPAAEVCANGVDDDCDGAVDEACSTGGPAALALSRHRSCAGMSDGSLRCWGSNLYGELGLGVRYRHQVHPREVPGGSSRVAVGTDFVCSRQGDGSVRCSGRNQLGQLGDGGTVDRAAHAPVPGLSDVAELVAGEAFACARIATDGAVRCWGSDGFGELGRSAAGSCRASASAAVPCGVEPAPVAGLVGVVGLAAGAHHACARMADGSVRCWGDNASGQLGDGTTLGRAAPVTVTGLSDVVELAAGRAHTCARRHDGTVWCWGSNAQGQLGDGTTASRATPAAVAGLRDVAQIASGDRSVCARMTDGTLRCWGGNAWGQLGDGTLVTRVAPTAVAGLIRVAEVALGGEHTCVRLTAGSVLCWGRNLYGQLGDGSIADRRVPRMVTF